MPYHSEAHKAENNELRLTDSDSLAFNQLCLKLTAAKVACLLNET